MKISMVLNSLWSFLNDGKQTPGYKAVYLSPSEHLWFMFESVNSSQKTLKKHVYLLALIVGVFMVGSVSNKKIHIKNNILSMEKRNHNNQTKYFTDPSVEKLIKFFQKWKLGFIQDFMKSFFESWNILKHRISVPNFVIKKIKFVWTLSVIWNAHNGPLNESMFFLVFVSINYSP